MPTFGLYVVLCKHAPTFYPLNKFSKKSQNFDFSRKYSITYSLVLAHVFYFANKNPEDRPIVSKITILNILSLVRLSLKLKVKSKGDIGGLLKIFRYTSYESRYIITQIKGAFSIINVFGVFEL
jgi:hypothetical protein